MPGCVALALALAVSGLTACASTQQVARDQAVTAVRAQALALRTVFAAAAAGKSGAAQLEVVRAVLPDVPLTAAADGQGVRVTGAVTAKGEAGGGLSFKQFVARLCLRYTIAADTGVTEVADQSCDAKVESEAPGVTVRLNP